MPALNRSPWSGTRTLGGRPGLLAGPDPPPRPGLFMVMFSIVCMDFFRLEAAQAGYLTSFFGVLQMVSAGRRAWARDPGRDSVSLSTRLCTVTLRPCLSEPPALGPPWLCPHRGSTCRGPISEGGEDWGALGLLSAAAWPGSLVYRVRPGSRRDTEGGHTRWWGAGKENRGPVSCWSTM